MYIDIYIYTTMNVTENKRKLKIRENIFKE